MVVLERPEAGVHYPGSLADLRAWFPDDAACLDYLDWLRWPGGFLCLWGSRMRPLALIWAFMRLARIR